MEFGSKKYEEFLALPGAAELTASFSENIVKRVVLYFSHCLNVLKNVGENKDDTEQDHPDIEVLKNLTNCQLDNPVPVQEHLLKCGFCRLYTLFDFYVEDALERGREVDQECAGLVAQVLRQAADNKLESASYGARIGARL